MNQPSYYSASVADYEQLTHTGTGN